MSGSAERWVRAKDSRTDRDIVADGGRHGDGVGGGTETAGTGGPCRGGSVRKVEFEGFIGEEADPCDVSRGVQEVHDELVGLGGNGGEGDRGEEE